MSETFSEGWYRVANLKIALRPNVIFRRQISRGTCWYVVHDPYAGNYFRLDQATYQFVTLLDFSRTVEEVWTLALERDPKNAPGQKEVINLLVELNRANLLYFKDPKNSDALYEKGSKKRKKELRQQWMNILFLRFPVWNPNQWLTNLLPLWKFLFSKYTSIIWIAVVALGVKTGLEHRYAIANQAEGVLAPGNLFMLYAGLAIIKIFHEIGHSAMCKRFGGEVTNIGVMLLIFTPLPYVDATASWKFQDKWERILVSSAGMMVELFMGALACVVWAYSPPGILHSLAYNMMFTATVSTVLFNVNPLMRFDGYYILTDLIEIPNLYQKGRDFVTRFFSKYLFGIKNSVLPGQTRWEQTLLLIYGIASAIYRVVLFVGIGLFVADRYMLAGMIFAVFLVGSSLLKPIYGYMKYLFASPELRGRRFRALFFSFGILSLGVYLMGFISFSQEILAPGIIETKNENLVSTEISGQINQIRAVPQRAVKEGDVILSLANRELDFDQARVRYQLRQVEISEHQALFEGSLDIAPLKKRKETLLQYEKQLEEKKKKLTLRASQTGVWVFPDANEVKQQWLSKGQSVGTLIDNQNFRFTAIVSQEDASDLFNKEIQGIKVRLKSNPDETLIPATISLIPHAREFLPSASLGWKGGGPVMLSSSDQDGTKTREPFYMLQADIAPDSSDWLLNGLTGFMLIELPPQTLADRGVRYLRQFFQKRYQL